MIAIVRALLRSFAVDKAALALAFAAPIAFFAMFGMFFEHLDDPNGMHFDVAVVLESDDPLARTLANAILARSEGRIAITPLASDASAAERERFVGRILIPRDFQATAPRVAIETNSPLPGVGDALRQLTAAACAGALSPNSPHVHIEDHSRHGALMRAAAPGIPVMFALFALSSLAARGLGDDEAGLAERLRSLGVSATGRMLARFATLALIAFAQLAVSLAFAIVAFGLVPAAPTALALSALAASFTCAAFVVALAELCGNRARFAAISPVCTLMLAGLGGSMVPTALLPHALAWPSRWLFTGWSIDACSRAIDGEFPAPQLVALACAAAALVALAALLAQRNEFR